MDLFPPAHEANSPASATPSRNRTALADALFRTKANAIERAPNVMVYRGIALPGPIHLVKRFAGISKMIYLIDTRGRHEEYEQKMGRLRGKHIRDVEH